MHKDEDCPKGVKQIYKMKGELEDLLNQMQEKRGA
jgi:hypothetical protein